MKTLHLNLKKKWFDMILSGEKKEEYREIKPSIVSLLFDWRNVANTREFIVDTLLHNNEDVLCWSCLKNYDTITFSNGMKSIDEVPRFEIEFEEIEIKTGRTEWGAEKFKLYFVLKLGKILNKQNC